MNLRLLPPHRVHTYHYGDVLLHHGVSDEDFRLQHDIPFLAVIDISLHHLSGECVELGNRNVLVKLDVGFSLLKSEGSEYLL